MTRLKSPNGQRFHVLPGNGAEKDQLQKLIVRQRRAACLQEPVAQALSVVRDVGRQPPGQRLRFRLIGIPRRRDQG